jgi:hypothetical protein
MDYAMAWLQAMELTRTTTHHATFHQHNETFHQPPSHRLVQHPDLLAGSCLLQALYLLYHGTRPMMHRRLLLHPDSERHQDQAMDFSIFISPLHSHIIPARAWDYLAASSVVHSNTTQDHRYPQHIHAMVSTNLPADSPTSIDNIQQGSDVYRTFIRQGLTSAAMWTAMGHFPLAQVHIHLVLDSYRELVSTDQMTDAALQDMAISIRYGPTFSFNPHTTTTTTLPSDITLYSQSFALNETAAYQADWTKTTSYQHIIHSSLPIIYKYGIEYLIDAMGSTALVLIRQKLYDKAKAMLQQICTYCQQHSFHSRHAYYLLQQSIIYISIQDPIGALPSLLSCLSLCDSKLLNSMHAAASSILARVFYELDDGRCKHILKAVLPRLVQYGMTWFIGESWLTLAKCTLADVNQNSSRLPSGLHTTLSHLSQSEHAFYIMKDNVRLREIYYLKAHIYHRLDNKIQRNIEAKRFQDMKQCLDSSLFPTWVDPFRVGTKL